VFIGNKKNLDFFEKAVENGRLAHAYCFCGPSGVGKMTLVKKIAAKVLKTDENFLQQNPNFHIFQREIDEKTGKIKKEITVSQAREIKELVAKKSWVTEGQFFIIDGADYLNAESGNALLKVLEEPSQGSYLFFLGDHEKNILPTILSRCQKIFFYPVGKKEILERLTEFGYDQKESELAAKLSGGLPGKALTLIKDKEIIEEYKAEVRKWLSMFKMGFAERINLLEEFFSEKDGNKSRDALIKKMDFWMGLWREVMLFRTEGRVSDLLKESDLAILNYSPLEIGLIIDEIVKTQNYLKNNVQTRLAVEQFLLKF